MKKLLRNAALLSASLMALNAAAGASAAGQGPVLSFGGSMTGAAAAVNQTKRVQGNPPAVTFLSKGNLVMNVGGTSNSGIGYGAVGVLNFDRAKSNQNRIDEAYLYMNHDCIGNVKIGDTEGIVTTMMYTGDDVLGGLGGASGDFDKLVNIPNTVGIRPNIADANNSKATKLVWISPEMRGFQIGLDFTPSTKLYGRQTQGASFGSSSSIANASAVPYAKNLLGGGLSYNKAFSMFNLGLYAVGQTGTVRNDSTAAGGGTIGTQSANGLIASGQDFRDVSSYQLGALFDYQNWQFAGSYFDNKKSFIRSTRTEYENTKGMNVAVAYDFARNANVGIGFTQTRRKVNGGHSKANIVTGTLDYVVAPGWVTFAEVDYFNLRAPNAALTDANLVTTGADLFVTPVVNNNRGTLLVVGTKVRF